MVNLTELLKKIFIELPESIPFPPLFFWPLTKVKNIYFTTPKSTEEVYQIEGFDLYQLAQASNIANVTFSNRQFRIRNVTQAVAVGLSVNRTILPPVGNIGVLGYHRNDILDTITGNSIDRLLTPNNGEIADIPRQYFAANQPQSNSLAVSEKRSGINNRGNAPEDWRLTNEVVSEERHFSGKVAQQKEVQLTGKNDQLKIESGKLRVRGRLNGPEGEVPEAPSLADFAETNEISLTDHLGPEGVVPEAPSLADFAETNEISLTDHSGPEGVVPEAPSLADFAETNEIRLADQSGPEGEVPEAPSLADFIVKPRSQSPAEMPDVSATRFGAGLAEETVGAALSAGGAELGSAVGASGGALVIGTLGIAGVASLSSNKQPKITGQGDTSSKATDDKYAKRRKGDVKDDSMYAKPVKPVMILVNRAGQSVLNEAAHAAESDVTVKLDLSTPAALPASVGRPAPLATPEADFALDALNKSPLRHQILDRCEITLAANQDGFRVKNLNPEYYDRGAIYEVREIDADLSEPVHRCYVLMDGKRVAVRPVVMPVNGVKYEIYDESHPAKGYALTFSCGRWQLQEPTSLQLTDPLIQAITPDMIATDRMEATLSVPDDRGLQWSHDQKSYLRIKGHYIHVLQDQNNINNYRIESLDKLHGINLYYHKSRFWLSVKSDNHILAKSNVKDEEKATHCKLIKKYLMNAYIHMKENNVIRCFAKIKAALVLHAKIEAGSIKQISILTLDFLEHFLKFYGRDDLYGAEKLTIQTAWVRHVRLPLSKNTQVRPKRINELFTDVPHFLKMLTDYVLEKPVVSILEKFQTSIRSLSTEPMPQYGINSKQKQFHYKSEGSIVLTNITIYGNSYFIKRVVTVLNEIRKMNLGKKIIEDLKDKSFTIHPPTMNAIEREKEGKFYAKNSAGGNIAFDPDNRIIGRERALCDEPWRKRAPAVALYHELLHIYYKYQNVTFTSVDGKIKQKIVGGHSAVDEGLIVGVNVYKEKTFSLFEFGNKAYLAKYNCEPISENEFRKEYAMMNHKEYFLRPYYVKHRNKKLKKK